MLIFAFLKGCAMGFSIAAPVGPIGLLCIRRTCENGRLAGLITGLGAAAADAVYALLAAFGLTLSSNLIHGSFWLHVIAGVFLVILGIRMAMAEPARTSATAGGATAFWWFASTFLLTISNPLTILSFIAVFAALGTADGGLTGNLVMTLGVFTGSVAWWIILSGGIAVLGLSGKPKWSAWIGRISGCAIAGFGLFALLAG